MDKFTAEARLVSERLGRFEFLAGLFYTDESNTYRANLFIADSTGTPLASPFDVLVRTTTSSDYKELAGYGNLTFYFTDNFDVTGGIRVARNEQKAQTGGPNSVVFYRPRAIANFEFEDTVTTWLGTVRWRPTPDISTFLRAASGFRPGGPQNNPAPPPGAQTTIRPDSVWNYEAGVRATVLEGTFNINASIYRIDWTDIQLQGLFNNIVLQANGGAARVDGAEMEVVARPVTGLTLAANAGYTNARITEVDAGRVCEHRRSCRRPAAVDSGIHARPDRRLPSAARQWERAELRLDATVSLRHAQFLFKYCAEPQHEGAECHDAGPEGRHQFVGL